MRSFEKRPIFKQPIVYGVYFAIAGAIGYWTIGVEQRQQDFMMKYQQRLRDLKSKKERLEYENTR